MNPNRPDRERLEKHENEERLAGPDARQTRQTREMDAGLNAVRHRRLRAGHAFGVFSVFRGHPSRLLPFRVFRLQPIRLTVQPVKVR